MPITKWAFIFQSPGFNSSINTTRLKSDLCEMICVGVGYPLTEDVLKIAKNLVDNEKVQFIELCGGFGPIYVAKIIEAIDNKTPVGSVLYGPECFRRMMEIGSK